MGSPLFSSRMVSTMAFIDYIPRDDIPQADRIDDDDNILRIHGVHSAMMPRHMVLYKQLMFSAGPLTRAQREMIAVVVSNENACHY